MVPSHAGSKKAFGLPKSAMGEKSQSGHCVKCFLVANHSKHSQVLRPWSCCCSNISCLHFFLLLVKRAAGNLITNPFQSYSQNFTILFDSAQVLVCCVIHSMWEKNKAQQPLFLLGCGVLWPHSKPYHLESSKLQVNAYQADKRVSPLQRDTHNEHS